MYIYAATELRRQALRDSGHEAIEELLRRLCDWPEVVLRTDR